MNKAALKAAAKITHINLQEAAETIRQNPLLGEEIHIEEELINLEESIKTYHMAADTLEHYPGMKLQMIREKRAILKHCMGMVLRMIHGNRLPHSYTENDTQAATRKLVRLSIEDLQRSGIAIEGDELETVRPLLSWHQRLTLSELRIVKQPLAFVVRGLAAAKLL